MRTEPRTPTEARLLPIARLFWPRLEETGAGDIERASRLADVLGSLYAAPVALAGLIWLVTATDVSVLRGDWPSLLLFLAVAVLLRRLMFAMFIEVRPGDRADLRGSLAGIISWAAALSFGPTGLWLTVAEVVSSQVLHGRHSSAPVRWNRTRNLLLELAEVTAGLIGLTVYRVLNGAHAPFGPEPRILAPAVVATGTRYALSQIVVAPLLLYWVKVSRERTPEYRLGPYLAATVGLPLLIDPFAIVVAILYARTNLGMVVFFSAGLFLVSLLAHRLSGAAVRSRQRARELERLEQLGRDMIGTPIDAATLSDLLGDHIPAMLPSLHVDVRLFPDQILYQYPEGQSPLQEEAWTWLQRTGEARCFLPGDERPWDGAPGTDDEYAERPLMTAPILKPDVTEPVGGIALAQQTRMTWEAGEMTRSLPAVQTLASQIGSALRGAELYRMEQELSLAGQIQTSFLPSELPNPPGWQIVATLRSARQTAGDFYDVIPLPNGRLGLLIADVADKGMGAALYMALCRTLLRTYALEYHNRPDFVMKVTNRRLLMDSDVTMFVTVFYGILDPRTGVLTYCNAGHNPPVLVRASDSARADTLQKTGMALGAMPGLTWDCGNAEINPRDFILLYTDGITDAQDAAGTFFGRERLLKIIQDCVGRSASLVQDSLMEAVAAFAGGAPQFDDMTLLIAVRDASP